MQLGCQGPLSACTCKPSPVGSWRCCVGAAMIDPFVWRLAILLGATSAISIREGSPYVGNTDVVTAAALHPGLASPILTMALHQIRVAVDALHPRRHDIRTGKDDAHKGHSTNPGSGNQAALTPGNNSHGRHVLSPLLYAKIPH
jgi:hypothetical protein